MRVSRMLATALLLAAGGLSSPVQPLGSSVLDISDLADGAYADVAPDEFPVGPKSVHRRDWPPNDPIDHNSYCRRDTLPGTNLTKEEKKPMLECFEKMEKKGDWVTDWTHCNHTQRYFTAWGLWWKNPEDCYHACKRCFMGAILSGASNWYCFQAAGFMAQCNISVYDLGLECFAEY
ncbi:hypothetical protein F4813DRAFT_399679 [Daldinia decipiens]|uniref:uncharacterized protein n=1 Tax=Daldinia decipiens TaxID=326647 RepID=UPI0020C4470D|nr:uncharacterized protein F4813DRAFT_399679 [Daldinia decipiens]KAI1653712.1 hypothetical protein F4813DRAFT_399679 [Daldinia decipiens]